MALVLRNTFLDLAEPEEKGCAKRSTSAPPALKPEKTWQSFESDSEVHENDERRAWASDTSTTVSDNEVPSITPSSSGIGDLQNITYSDDDHVYDRNADEMVDRRESVARTTQPKPGGKVTLCLDAAITCNTAEGVVCQKAEALAEESESDSLDSKPLPSSGKLTLCLDATVKSSLGTDVTHQSMECKYELSDFTDSDLQLWNENVPLCLDCTVQGSDGDAGLRTKLSSRARAFVPTTGGLDESVHTGGLDEEIYTLIEGVREVLQGCPDVLSIQVTEGGMGGITTVLAELRSSCLGAATMEQTTSLIKATLLNVASNSEHTYILGYGAEPFKNTRRGFKAQVGCVSALQEHSVCWDTYEFGCCQNRNRCRWWHPMPADLMQLVVTLKETA